MATKGTRISQGDTRLVGERGRAGGRRTPRASRPLLPVHRRKARREQRRRDDAVDRAIIDARRADPANAVPIPWEQVKAELGL